MQHPNKIFITGYARLPEGITATSLYEVVGTGLVIDKTSGTILEADISLATMSGRNFFSEILIGSNINNIENIIEVFEECYLGSAKKAIITALRNVHKKYVAFKKGE